MNYFNLVSFDNTHYGIHVGARFFLLLQTSQVLFWDALGRNGMAQAHACRLNHMLEVPNLTADMISRHPTTQVTWIARTTLSDKYSLAAMLHLNLSPASGLNAQDAASGEPVICAHHLGPGKRKRQPMQ